MTIPELILTGTPTQRGEIHGEAMREQIAGQIDRWMDAVGKQNATNDFIPQLVNNTGFLSAARQHAPALVEEVHGLANGSGQPFEQMFAWQLLDEGWWYLAAMNGEMVPLERCSALAINQGDIGIVAQTQDLDRHYDGGHVLLRHLGPDNIEILSPSIAGLLALNGVNSHGLAVAITTLSPLAHSEHGIPSGFLLPLLLRCPSIDDAVGLLHRLPIASGNSFLLGERDRSVVAEVSATAVVVESGGRVLRTNHPLAQDPAWDYARFSSSTERLAQLDATVKANSTVDDLKAMYATGAVCQSRARDDEFVSVGTMLFEMGDQQLCHYAAGPLDTEQVTTFKMSGEIA